MTVQIPIGAIPWQTFSVVLDGQNCMISIRQVAENLYCDLTVNDIEIFKGAICADRSAINQYPSRYFSGTLYFVDTKGHERPYYDELNSRWILCYDAEE